MTNYRDELGYEFPPPVFGGPLGSKFLGIVALTADAVQHGFAVALRAPWLRSAYSPDDALPEIGSERLMPRYPVETAAQHRARLLDAWDIWTWAGDEASIEGQFIAAGFFGTLATLDELVELSPPPEKLLNGTFEEGSPPDDWAAGANTTLTAQSGKRTGGSGAQVLRVANTAPGATSNADQVAMTIGTRYRVSGWARGDAGNGLPRVLDTGAVKWTGTTSDTWEQFVVEFTATTTTLRLGLSGNPGTADHAEFDDVSVVEATGWGNANVVVTGGQDDPDGGTDAVLVTATVDTGNTTHTISSTASSAPLGVQDFIIALKAGTLTEIYLESGGNRFGFVDLVTGAAGVEGDEATIHTWPAKETGWWWVRLRYVRTASPTFPVVALVSGGTFSYPDDGTGTIYAYQPRVTSPEVQVYTAQDWPTRGDPTHWSQFWVHVPEGAHLAGTAKLWSQLGYWNPGAVWGSSLTPPAAETVRKICMKWKPGHWVCRQVIFEVSAPLAGTGLKWGMPGLVWGGESVKVGVQP